MTLLPRIEQEKLILSFERDYQKIIRHFDKQQLLKLLREIKKTANPKYVEEDVKSFLEGMQDSIYRDYDEKIAA